MKFFCNLILLLTAILPLNAQEAFSYGKDAPWQKSSIIGKFSVSKDNILSLDGKSTGIDIDTKLLNNPEKGISLLAVLKHTKFPYLSSNDKVHDAIFCRRHQFIMGIDYDRFYVNFHNGTKWFVPLLVNVKLNDNQFHSFAMTSTANSKLSKMTAWRNSWFTTHASNCHSGVCVANDRILYK